MDGPKHADMVYDSAEIRYMARYRAASCMQHHSSYIIGLARSIYTADMDLRHNTLKPPDPATFIEEYKGGRGVEMGQRCYEEYRLRTTGRDDFVRILLVPFVMYNDWALVHRLAENTDGWERPRRSFPCS